MMSIILGVSKSYTPLYKTGIDTINYWQTPTIKALKHKGMVVYGDTIYWYLQVAVVIYSHSVYI